MDIFHERLNIMYEECRDRDPSCGRRGFARLCKTSFYKIDNYLSGKGMPAIDTLRTIAASLDVNPSWLLGLSEERHEDKRALQKWVEELSQAQIDEVLNFVNYMRFKDQFNEFISGKKRRK